VPKKGAREKGRPEFPSSFAAPTHHEGARDVMGALTLSNWCATQKNGQFLAACGPEQRGAVNAAPYGDVDATATDGCESGPQRSGAQMKRPRRSEQLDRRAKRRVRLSVPSNREAKNLGSKGLPTDWALSNSGSEIIGGWVLGQPPFIWTMRVGFNKRTSSWRYVRPADDRCRPRLVALNPRSRFQMVKL